MNINNKQFIFAAVAALGIASLLYGVASATVNNAQNNPMSVLVTAIAEKFNLNVNDVQAVFDEQRAKMDAGRKAKMAEMETKRQEEFASRLNEAVAKGDLTQEQANLITAKRAELEAIRTNFEGKTPQEQQEAMKEQMNSLKQWMEENDIPQGYLPCGRGMGRGGHEGPEFKGPRSEEAQESSL